MTVGIDVPYSALRDRGKPAKRAHTAVMRKLPERANALVREDRGMDRKTGLTKTEL
jgi:hypothetical protein